MSVWFITGASRGFGLELARAALAAGDHVVASARDPRVVHAALPAPSGRLLALPLDVTDQQQAADVVSAAVERFGSIDVLVNNAGYGVFGSVEEISDAQARQLFDTNVFGLLNVTRAALPVLRAQGSGHIVNVGSSAGFAASAGGGLYSATKFAVEAITEALHAELTPLGLRVTVVQPGSFRTQFLTGDSLHRAEVGLSDYADTVGPLMTAASAYDGHQPGDPVRAVVAIRRLVETPEPPVRLQLGRDSVALVEDKLTSVAAELARWRELSLSTDFPTG
jgi:NAD(P)-dependent dehydrogenase (short-subunit alcohol dehydrogenase family)